MKPSTSLLSIILFYTSVFSQINTERFRQDADSTGLNGNADIGMTVMTGNTDFQFITLSSRLNNNWGNSYTFLVTDGGMGWTNGVRFFDQALSHLRHVATLNNFIQLETFLQYDFNKKRKLAERELIGSGLRFRLYTTGLIKFRLGIAYMFERERYTLPDQSRHAEHIAAHRLSNYVTFEIKVQKMLRFLTVSYFQPKIDDKNDFKVLSENALIVDMGKHLDITNSYNLRFDNMPPEHIKKLDGVTKFGLSVKF
jgi:hypothetical protein